MTAEIGADVPDHLRPYWEWDFCCFHSPEWWRTHWVKTGKVTVDRADAIPDGWRDRLRFNDLTTTGLTGRRSEAGANTHEMLTLDRGRTLGFARIVATKPTG